MTNQLHVEVDHVVCVGTALCRSVAASVFVPSASGQSVVADPHGDPLEAVLEAAELCPMGAITVTDAETGQPLTS
jgi:ferredoxin